MAETHRTRPQGHAPNREARYRIDAAHQLLERVDELGEEAVVTHGIQLLIGAAEFLELP